MSTQKAPGFAAESSQAPETHSGHGCVALPVTKTDACSGRLKVAWPLQVSTLPLALPVKSTSMQLDRAPIGNGRGGPYGHPALEHDVAPVPEVVGPRVQLWLAHAARSE